MINISVWPPDLTESRSRMKERKHTSKSDPKILYFVIIGNYYDFYIAINLVIEGSNFYFIFQSIKD